MEEEGGERGGGEGAKSSKPRFALLNCLGN